MSLTLKKFTPSGELCVSAPASKSILNRALLLSAFSGKEVKIVCGGLSEDTAAMIGCLNELAIPCITEADGVRVYGKTRPKNNVCLDVKSAGTVARFLSVALAFSGGDYRFNSSEQMSRRPMQILNLLEANGVSFDWLGEKYAFPFVLHSNIAKQNDEFTVDTDTSTQYASGILLAAPLRARPAVLHLTGKRTRGGYIEMTKKLLDDFGVRCERNGDTFVVYPSLCAPDIYEAEADLSGACYFFALALLFSMRVSVKGAKLSGMQSDIGFVRLLEEKGATFTQTETGVLCDATNVTGFTGFDADMGDFSDQVLTAAALAPFASTPSHLKNIAHIAKQECNRIEAAVENLASLGVKAVTDGESITVYPSEIHTGKIKTFGDHRVAMSFALIGLKTGKVEIDDPDCCKKTFEGYFDILERYFQ